MSDSHVDPKVFEKIRKLLTLAACEGATEGEASNAAAKAQTLMEAHNLSMASVEASGGSSGDDGKRTKDAVSNRTVYKWQRELMKSIAELNFCHCENRFVKKSDWNRKKVFDGYDLIGRASNVASTRVMFEYLVATINRLVREEVNGDGAQLFTRFACSFREGASDRVVERLETRRQEAVAESERKAKEEAARRSHPSYASTTLPAVVLSDFVQDERDLNEDARRGFDPGTTGRKKKERAALEANRDARMKDLQEVGYSWDVAWNIVYRGMTVEASIEHERELYEANRAREAAQKPETEAQAKKRRERDERNSQRYWEQARRRADREESRLDSAGYRRGKDAGRDIGLDAQVDEKVNRRIG